MAIDKHVDFEEGDLSDFYLTSDTEGKLSATAGAKKYGSYGMNVAFTSNTQAYGKVLFTSPNQVSAFLSFWFDPNGVTVENNGEVINIAWLLDGAVGIWGKIRYYKVGGVMKLQMSYKKDDLTYGVGSALTISDDYHEVALYIAASTGPGNNDGIMKSWIDGVIQDDISNIDNDTADFDWCALGTLLATDTSPSGAYFIDHINFDPNMQLFVLPPAAGLTMVFPTPTLAYKSFPAVLAALMILNVPAFRIEKISHAQRIRNLSTGKEIGTESTAMLLRNKSISKRIE